MTKSLEETSLLPPTTQQESFTSSTSTPSYSPSVGRYSKAKFHGIVIDTGAAFASIAGFRQFLALKRSQTDLTIDQDTANRVKFKFGIGTTSSKGTV